jgi:hypothetical protein
VAPVPSTCSPATGFSQMQQVDTAVPGVNAGYSNNAKSSSIVL